ncbi:MULTISPECIES: helix-turn-helix domain-containing protein [Pseudomonas]|uniref:Helix-turn-helix domain-containing protein n=1 Tax=Pseudomonas tritici TaxID=2745518 RepID=A0A8H9Z4S5_9PSED|nr:MULTISPECIES: helix-turn-helix transcriptional regulator [Pseudomonas]MBP2874824.1 helix-turn-helix transcriptional regulator [Pseudomonas sp. SWRI144]MBW8130638.1 helix-turn-helix domain-containing protein [Pseudomonas sp. LAP_36]MBW8139831.1 helix-turn-helix domain-containing protein [Pseudomonas sp. PAMC 26818]QXH85846.1 helix-turn-helix domain-containing protein [Pseudomonas tritici]CRM15208.1 putative transcriptional regulator [Pseudomonas sp. 24 R 17]
MDIQIISRNGEPEYAVLPWDQYQALLKAAGQQQPSPPPSSTAQAAPEQDLRLLADLRGLREAKGLAIETLARTVGISPSYLGLIESGERQPDAAIRRSLAWELGVAGWRDES